MEIVVKAKTVEEAVKLGAEKLGKGVGEVEYTVIEEAKKGFLGMFSSEAEVKVYCEDESEDTAESTAEEISETVEEKEENEDEAAVQYTDELPPVQDKIIDFLNTVIADMGVSATANVTRIDERLSENSKTYEKDIHIEIVGKGLGMLIGRHGDVLDSLQYLCNTIVGRYPKRTDKHEYIRIILDIENYRAKREETLKSLARRMASKVVATGRNFTLEPMSSYERRIIHSELQKMRGVHTFSVGADSNRRVVIAYGDDVNAEYDK